MKRHFFSWIMLGASVLFLLACESQRPVSSESSSEITSLEKGKVYTIESIKPELRKLLEFLKSNPRVITSEVLVKAAERHATITDLGLSERFPTEFPLEDGNTFEVYVELFDGSEGVGNSIEDAAAYFTLDLDRYPEDAGVADPDNVSKFQAHVAATERNKRERLYKDSQSLSELRLESTTQSVNYLLFFVGGEERLSQANEAALYQEWLKSRPDLAKAQASATTEYWWITKLQVHVDKDNGNDEFEMYYGPTGYDGSSHPFNATTPYLFDGTYRNDASGNSRYFPDINGPSVTDFIFGSGLDPIAIEVLTPDSPAGFKWCGIEDDCTASQHKNGGQGTVNQNMNGYDLNIPGPVTRRYYFTILDNCADDDDIYGNSATVSFGGISDSCRVSWPSAPHVRMCLRKGTVAQAASWTSQCTCF